MGYGSVKITLLMFIIAYFCNMRKRNAQKLNKRYVKFA